MQRMVRLVAGFATVVFLVGSVRLGQLEGAGPDHTDLVLDGGVPATVYLPGPPRGRAAFMSPPPPEERPPVLVLMHGYAGDRRSMSGLARRLAAAGSAVLAIDASGHGENRSPFKGSDARGEAFAADLAAAVDFLRAWPFVDGSRIAVGGHSMGGGASLDFATRDTGIDAAVLVSGGWRLAGPHRPPNVLIVYGEDDPERTRARIRGIAGELIDSPDAPGWEHGRTYGRHDRHDAVRVVEIPGANHASVVSNDETVNEIAAWLDSSFGRPSRGPAPGDPRAALVGLLALAFLLVLPGLGLVLGGLAPESPRRSPEGRLAGLGLVAAALFGTLPLLATGSPLSFLSAQVAEVVLAQLLLAGVALLVVLRLRWPEALAGLFESPLASTAAAAVGVLASVALLQPFASVIHGLLVTPERALLFALSTLALLPLALASSALLRRGGNRGAALGALAGHLLVLIAIIVGVRFGVLRSVVLMLVPAFAVAAVLVEILASTLYATSRNLLVISILDASWLALILASIMPLRA